jgi:phosphotransferase system enzyme I (PtsI)
MALRQLTNKFLHGVGASSGVVSGRAFLVDRSKVRAPEKKIDSADVEKEVDRFLKAIQSSRVQLIEVKEKILDPDVRRHAFILDVHLMILDDQMLVEGRSSDPKEEGDAEWAGSDLEKLDAVFMP